MREQILITTALEIAVAEIGVREIGSTNRGKRVDEYQAADSLPGFGYPWCASFTGWDLKEVARRLKLAERIPWTYSPSCDAVWADGRRRGLVHDKPQVGDFFIVRAKLGDGSYSKSDGIHTGVVRNLKGAYFSSVEGNSNADGSREGHSVVSLTRPINSRYVFIRWADGLRNTQILTPAPPEIKPWIVTLRAKDGTTKVFNSTAINGRPEIATRDFADFFRITVGWNAEDVQASLNGKEVPTQARIINGRSIYPVRVLGELVGYDVHADSTKRTVQVVMK